MDACEKRDFDRARQLISQGCDPKSAKGSGGWTPLHWGCWHGDFRFVRTLVEDHSCDPESGTTDRTWIGDYTKSAGSTPLHMASWYVPLLITCRSSPECLF